MVSQENGGPIRIGYARCSKHTQELAGQLDMLERAGCRRVFSEKISTRVSGFAPSWRTPWPWPARSSTPPATRL